ncbi:MAG: metallophosphoesterase [Clostridia bacterium]
MKKFIIVVSALFIAALMVLLYSNIAITTSEYDVNTKKIEGRATLVFLSDLHSRDFSSDNAELIRLVKSAKPDAILLGGDMINSKDDEFSVFFSLCKKLIEIAPVYAVLGNHEMLLPSKLLEEYKETLSDMGATFLDNSYIDIKTKAGDIRLYGLNIPLYLYSYEKVMQENGYNYTKEMIQKNLGEIDKTKLNLLLTHNPKFFETYAGAGFDITLCGHMHGGGLRIPFVGGVFSSDRTLFPKYDAAAFTIDEKTMIVGRGLSETFFPIRFFNPADVVVLKIGNDD